MIGFIITGHGSYSPGMLGAMEMITGVQEKVIVVPFLQDMTLEEYSREMTSGISTLKQDGLEIIIFADLLGGTPFKTSVVSANEYTGVEVVSGTNLPMLIEGSMLRLGMTCARELVDTLLQTGQEGIQCLDLTVRLNEEVCEVVENGI